MASLFTELIERVSASPDEITIKSVRKQMDAILFAGRLCSSISPKIRNDVTNQVLVALGLWTGDLKC